MVRSVIIFSVLLAFITLAKSLPNNVENAVGEKVTCGEGEVLADDGKCKKVLVEISKVQPINEKVKKNKKKSHKKRKLQKKLAKELKEIKKMVLDGIDPTSLNLPDVGCPDGQELNEAGQCAEIEIKKVVNGTETVVKKKKNLQKKLEREIEMVLKKEIQNELKKKKKRKTKKTPASERSEDNLQVEETPVAV